MPCGNGTKSQGKLIRKAIETGGKEQIEDVMAAIEETGALAYNNKLRENRIRKSIGKFKKIYPLRRTKKLWKPCHILRWTGIPEVRKL